jgi:hypothetical protein
MAATYAATGMTDGVREARSLLREYDEEHVRDGGHWMFKAVDTKVNFCAAHLIEWA